MTSNASTLAGSTVEQLEKASVRSASSKPFSSENEQPSVKQVGKGETTNSGDEDGVVYPGALQLTLLTIALCLAVFLIALVCSLSLDGCSKCG
jgi:hypothetical protein